MRIGLHKANQKFSKAMKATSGPKKEAAVVHRLEAAGLLRPAAKAQPLPRWTPRPLKGAPLSKTLREGRDAS